SYLNSHHVKALSANPPPDLQGTPFLEYSSLYWGIHAKRDLSDCAKCLALKLFGDYNNHMSTRILLKAQKNPYSRTIDSDKLSLFTGLHCASFFGIDEPSLFTGLHCASFFGIVEIVASLVEVGGCDINQKDCTGDTPLVWAAKYGHEGVVKILLGRDDVNPNTPDKYGQTPLSCAVWSGHEGVVKILLGRD